MLTRGLVDSYVDERVGRFVRLFRQWLVILVHNLQAVQVEVQLDSVQVVVALVL